MGNAIFFSDKFYNQWCIISTEVVHHLQTLYNDLDQLKVCTSEKEQKNHVKTSTKFNWQYLLPFLLGLYVLADCAYILWENELHYSFKEMPQLFSHLISPHELWQTTDVTMGIGFLMLPLIYGCLMVLPKLDYSCIIFLTVDKHDPRRIVMHCNEIELESKVAARIFTFRRKARRLIDLMMLSSWAQVGVFYISNFFHHWSGTGRDYWMTVVVCSFFFYAIFANIVLLFYFTLAAFYINIKLQYQAEKLFGLVSKLNGATPLAGKNHGRYHFWWQLKKAQAEQHRLHRELRLTNRFWSPYLTIYFGAYIFEVVYFAYAVFYIESEHPFAVLFNIFFASEFVFTLVVVTFACSLVVWKNTGNFRQLRQFCVHFDGQFSLSLSQLIEVDTMLADQAKVSELTFKLLNNYVINSQMFEMLLSYISLLFLMLLKKK